MRSFIATLAAAATVAALSASTVFAADRVVNVYNWSDYIDSSILDDFTKETGIKVVYDVYDSNETLETKLLAGGTGYDIVVPTSNFLSRQIKAGVYQKLDKSKLSNLKNMWPEIMDRAAKYDPGNAYAVDYMWGTTGIGYNVAKVKQALGSDENLSWDVLFKPEMAAKLKDCGIYMLDSPSDVIPSVLAWLGLNPDSHEQADLQKAEKVLTAIRPYVRKFHSSEYINALANGDICIALGFSGDVFQARNRAQEAKNNVEIGYVIPSQGAQMWFDMMAMPKDAPHVEEAHEFINYMMRPEVIAKATNFTVYANGNKASQQFVDKAILDDPSVYPSPELMNKLFTITPYDPKVQKVVTRIWTKVVTGQ